VLCIVATRGKIEKEYGDKIEVVHRSFALAPEPDGIARIFGSKEQGK